MSESGRAGPGQVLEGGTSGTNLTTSTSTDAATRIHSEADSSLSSINASKLARCSSLWEEALWSLAETERNAILRLGSRQDVDIEHICKLTAEKRDLCEQKRWTFKLSSKKIILRDKAEKIIVWLNKFKEAGDVIAQYDPQHFALPWAGIRILLQATVSECNQMGALLVGAEKVIRLVARCRIYEELYTFQSLPTAVTSIEQRLRSALTRLYTAILEYIHKSIQLYEKSTTKRAMNAFLNPGQVENFIKDCECREIEVEKEVEICKHVLGDIALNERTRRLEGLLSDLHGPIARVDSKVESLWRLQQEKEMCSILGWLSDIPYEANHYAARKGHTPGTGVWLLEHTAYRRWRASSASTMLWLYGIPGAGKTKLVTSVVEDLMSFLGQHTNHEALAYFYCAREGPDRQDPASVIRSFVRQLSLGQDSIQSCIVKLYETKQRNNFASGPLTIEEGAKILRELVEIYPQTTLVLDALDECDPRTRDKVVEIFHDLLQRSSKPVKIFLSSRPDVDIKALLNDVPSLQIQATDNSADIATFVMSEILKKKKMKKMPRDLLEEILQTLLTKSEGMFQWAALQLAQLLDLDRPTDIRRRLGTLPDGLKKAYEEIYAKIRAKPGSAGEIAARAFQWISYSRDVLSAAELVAAVSHASEGNDTEPIDYDIDFVLGACDNLLVVETAWILGQGLSSICRFSHLSVREYFETEVIEQPQAENYLAKACLRTMLNFKPAAEPTSPSSECERVDHLDMCKAFLQPAQTRTDQLLGYAIRYWLAHLTARGEGREDHCLSELLPRFLGSIRHTGPACRAWLHTHGIWRFMLDQAIVDRFGDRVLDFYALYCLSRSPLSLVCLFGLSNHHPDWWENGFTDTEKKSRIGYSLLTLAALGGANATIEKLVDLGIDINTPSHGFSDCHNSRATVPCLCSAPGSTGSDFAIPPTALQAAVYGGHTETAHLLIKLGARVNTFSALYGTPLEAAVICDYYKDVYAQAKCFGDEIKLRSASVEAMVRLLLHAGVDVNARVAPYGRKLTNFVTGSLRQVFLLPALGSRRHSREDYYVTVLQAASLLGHAATVRLLLDHGALIDAQGGFFQSALIAASAMDHTTSMRILLASGAEINTRHEGVQPSSALLAACIQGHESAARVLLDSGADVNIRVEGSCTPLQEASTRGDEAMVRLLLGYNVDVNARWGLAGTALQAACLCHTRNLSVIRLLLGSGADVHIQSGFFGTALMAAVNVGCLLDVGSEEALRLLMGFSADINAQSHHHGTALQSACLGGSEAMVRLLLDFGADVNAQCGLYGTAIQAACYREAEPIVHLLLDAGADVNIIGGEYNTALQAARAKGNESIIRLLRDHGAREVATKEDVRDTRPSTTEIAWQQ